MNNFIKYRKEKEKTDIIYLEKKLGFDIPLMYRVFIETFDVGNGNVIYESFLNPHKNTLVPCVSIVYQLQYSDIEIYFNGFFDTEELINDWENYTKTSKEWNDYGLLRIGDIGMGGGLFLGTKQEMRDKIYLVVWDWDKDYEYIANNIWEYYSGLKVIEDFSNMGKYKYSQLYKNWGEDFWRVREE